jgi:putative tryptophan/tyrosine transport system substrate-binding protein
MKRRQFITFVGVAATAWPRSGWAQMSKKMARIGVLWHGGSAEEEALYLNALVEGIANLGWVKGKNVEFEHPFPAEQPERFKAFADELAKLDLDLIITSAANATFAAKGATKTDPIIFIFVADPVETGLVDSLAHPGGNITGFAMVDVSQKRLEVFKEAFPPMSKAVLLFNGDHQAAGKRFTDSMRAAADNLELAVQVVEVRGPQDLERAFAEIHGDGKTGIVYAVDSLFLANRRRIAQLALAGGLPVMAYSAVHVRDGNFASYGPDPVEMFRRAGAYVDKILKGTKPADLPVEEPTKYNLAVNLKTAKALGLTVPPSLLTRADEAIE